MKAGMVTMLLLALRLRAFAVNELLFLSLLPRWVVLRSAHPARRVFCAGFQLFEFDCKLLK